MYAYYAFPRNEMYAYYAAQESALVPDCISSTIAEC
uniref:Uncharacterized protein n=1 Tax=Arundo donax TaxID=35708 RepID=A0A0A9C3I8_ARUDO